MTTATRTTTTANTTATTPAGAPPGRALPAAPDRFGVGGGNAWARTEPVTPSRLGLALADLTRWQGRRPTAGFRGPALFPYEALLGYLRSVGRNTADSGLVSELRELQPTVIRPDVPAPLTGDARLLAAWLPMTFDTGTGTYDSYIGAPVLESLGDRLRSWPRTHVVDTAIVAALADLVLIEAEALEADPTSKPQTVRVRAALQALLGAPRFAPEATTTRWPNAPVLPTTPAELVDAAQELAGLVLDATPDCIRRSVSVSLLPTTPVHDELMFIRSIQVFELLYQQVARCLEVTIDEVRGGDPAAAVAELHDATARVRATPVLYRLLTTMPKQSFALIRAATDGRSAIQSRAYNRIERLCTRTTQGPAGAPGTPTVEEVVGSHREANTPFFHQTLIAAMRGLDDAWLSMKRTHWGVALKIIGRVPGTGGTAGADYLQVKAQQPLFPALADGLRS